MATISSRGEIVETSGELPAVGQQVVAHRGRVHASQPIVAAQLDELNDR